MKRALNGDTLVMYGIVVSASVSVYLFACLFAYLKTTRPNFAKFSLRVTYGNGSVLL